MPDAEPSKLLSLGAIEQWDAHQGIGNLTARRMMDRAMQLADDHGIGLVALRNANHWMRGGGYGWQAAEKGYIGICWTNSIAVMPPWGAKTCRIGTNPLIVAVPGNPITMVDMSMSMFSYGALELNRLAGKTLPVDGGFDNDGHLTRDPATIEENRRILPMGYWKGSALSIVLDMIATLLSGGASVAEVTEEHRDEYGVSQVFIAIEIDRLIDGDSRDQNCSASWTTSPAPNGTIPTSPFACRATSSRAFWKKTCATAFRLTNESGRAFRRYNGRIIMIFGHIANTAPEQYPTPVANAVAYLQRIDFSVLPAGRYEDPATGYVVQVLDLHTQPPDALRPEVHRQNVDVQFLVSGTELIGVAADSGDNVVHQELLAQRDIPVLSGRGRRILAHDATRQLRGIFSAGRASPGLH